MESEFEKVPRKSFSKYSPFKLIEYKGICIFESYLLIADSIEKFEVRDDDIWVCSFPRTGTTWTQEMVWAIANDLDFEGAKVELLHRFPYLEVSGTAPEILIMNGMPDNQLNSVQYISNMPSPRFIKTHLPFHLLPRQLREGQKKAKIVYVTRNPKDTSISIYYYRKLVGNCPEDFESFCNRFLNEKNYYAPFWNHVNGYWVRESDKNLLCLKYEDMKTNLAMVLRKIASFFGKELNAKQVENLESHLSFCNMKKNPAVNREVNIKKLHETVLYVNSKAAFMRKGCVDEWKTEMSSELIKEFDDWIAENLKKFPNLCNDFL